MANVVNILHRAGLLGKTDIPLPRAAHLLDDSFFERWGVLLAVEAAQQLDARLGCRASRVG